MPALVTSRDSVVKRQDQSKKSCASHGDLVKGVLSDLTAHGRADWQAPTSTIAKQRLDRLPMQSSRKISGKDEEKRQA